MGRKEIFLARFWIEMMTKKIIFEEKKEVSERYIENCEL
jgi:hypothetical protein